jgi:signal transduction histidine kinase
MRLAAERGAKLTGQLLAFSRRQLLVPKPVDLSDTLANMHDLLQSTLGNSVQIKTSFKSDLWPALVDPSQIELAVLNLAINARDASQVGDSITLETANATVGPPQNAHEPPAGEYVVVAVTDTGTGIAQYADAPHALALLRACRQRPRRSTAKKLDELAPPHCRPRGLGLGHRIGSNEAR